MFKHKLFAASAILLVTSVVCGNPQVVSARQNQRLLAAKTQQFTEKAGFERKEKDVINTLKDNDVAKFSMLLD